MQERLVERLGQLYAQLSTAGKSYDPETAYDAIQRIETLEQRVKVLEEALEDMLAVHHGLGTRRCTKSEAFANARAALKEQP